MSRRDWWPRSRRAVQVPGAWNSGPSNVRHGRADQTTHTAPDTIAEPVESATDRSSHAASIVAANPAGRLRRTPPTRRPPASLPAVGATRRNTPGETAAALYALIARPSKIRKRALRQSPPRLVGSSVMSMVHDSL